MTAATLECNHCGGVAIESEDGYFYEGDADKCLSCGMPGHVVVDGDDEDPDLNPVQWSDVSESGTYCDRADCEDCAEMRVEDGRPAPHKSESAETMNTKERG